MSLDDLNIQYVGLPPSTVSIYSHVVYVLDIIFWPQFVLSLYCSAPYILSIQLI